MKLGESVWHCHRTSEEGADIITYADPVEYKTRFGYITVQPTRVALNNMAGFYSTQEFGENIAIGWNVIANYDIFKDKIFEGDLFFVDGRKPVDGKPNGYNANAIVTSVREQNKAIFYTLNKIEGS